MRKIKHLFDLPEQHLEKTCVDFTSEITSIKNIFPIVYDEVTRELEDCQLKFDSFTIKKDLDDENEMSKMHPMPITKRTEYITLKENLDIRKYAKKNIPSTF